MTNAPGQLHRPQQPSTRSVVGRARSLFRDNQFSEAKGYSDMARGEYDTCLIGGRRYIFIESFLEYLERLRLGLERDPEAKAEAARRYAETAAISKARYAPKNGTTHRTNSKKRSNAANCLEIDRTLHPPHTSPK